MAPRDSRFLPDPTPVDDSHPEDARACEVARAALAGAIPEKTARWQIAAVVDGSDVATEVAEQWMAQNSAWVRNRAQQTRDLAEQLTHLMINKTVGLTGDGSRTTPSVDLKVIAEGKSIRGWMRSFAKTAALSEHRKIVRAEAREQKFGIRADHDDDDHDGLAASAEIRGKLSVDDNTAITPGRIAARHAADEGIAEFESQAKGAREFSRVHIAAGALCTGMKLPLPARIISTGRRAKLLTILKSDPNAPTAVVTAMATGAKVDPSYRALADVFSGYSPRDIARMADMDARVPTVLAMSSATPTLAPTAGKCRALRESATIGIPDDHRSLVLAAVDAWLAMRAEAEGTEYGRNAVVTPKSDDHRAADRRAYESAAHELTRWSTDFGRDAVEVDAAFDRLLRRVARSEVV